MINIKVMTKTEYDTKQQEVLERFKQFQQALIDKDEETLTQIIADSYTLTHMSGKTQTKQEFINEINDGTLNYYTSTVIEPEITIENEAYARIVADVKLDAKVYGITGTWTLSTDITMKKVDNDWIIDKWDN